MEKRQKNSKKRPKNNPGGHVPLPTPMPKVQLAASLQTHILQREETENDPFYSLML